MEPEGSVPRYSRAWLFFYAHFTEVTDIRKLKKYTPTPFMAKGSHYDKALADYAVASSNVSATPKAPGRESPSS